MDHTYHDRERGLEVRKKLNHPIVDFDEHAVELGSALPDFLKQIAGADEIEKWESQIGAPTVVPTPPGGWFLGSLGPISIDRATAMLPDFFIGTAIEEQANKVLAADKKARTAE